MLVIIFAYTIHTIMAKSTIQHIKILTLDFILKGTGKAKLDYCWSLEVEPYHRIFNSVINLLIETCRSTFGSENIFRGYTTVLQTHQILTYVPGTYVYIWVFHKICHDFNCTWWYHITCKQVFFLHHVIARAWEFLYSVFGITLRHEAAE